MQRRADLTRRDERQSRFLGKPQAEMRRLAKEVAREAGIGDYCLPAADCGPNTARNAFSAAGW